MLRLVDDAVAFGKFCVTVFAVFVIAALGVLALIDVLVKVWVRLYV